MDNYRYTECPGCKKNRLLKLETSTGELVSTSYETVDVRGEARFIDVCNFCLKKYQYTDEKFIKDNLKKLQRATTIPGASDHNDFSLNI